MKKEFHAKLSPSSSHRWLNCTASPKAEEGYAETSSDAATEGTLAHALAEEWLKGEVTPIKGATPDMEEHIHGYVDYVNSWVGLKSKLFIERRWYYDEWVKDGSGSADAVIFNKESKTLTVVDLKYGRNAVYAEKNTQGLFYALGAYHELSLVYEIETIVIVIHQPRLDNVSEWEITPADLLKWAEGVKQIADDIESGNTSYNPAPKTCLWCLAKGDCAALKKHTEQVIGSQFDDLTQDLTKLSDNEKRLIIDNKKLIVGFIDAVENTVKERLEKGEEFNGYKLVAGQSTRQWSDVGYAESCLKGLLKAEAYEYKLLSPAKAEKALGKTKAKDIKELITKKAGRPVMAPADDRRKEIKIITAKDFD